MLNELPIIRSIKHQGGRPSSCTPEILAKARNYIETYPYLGDVMPTMQGMALHMRVTRKTLYNWARNPNNWEFLHIYESCMSKQGLALINKGLIGQFNMSLCMMMLTKHGYVIKRQNRAIYANEELGPKEKARLDQILKNRLAYG